MRAGGCTVQQALTPDAASVVKQALSLARQRGNPQVTPLHVASAMLQQHQHQVSGSSSSTGLLRAACLRSHSHPLQCKALELCFNVALNRLPTSTSPLLGHGHVYYPPSLSNALVAAFKRAQAHQRRGTSSSADAQQPVLAAVKIELEQLVVSILDDPSVSRVMREAGFSSTQVKANVEHAVSSVVEGNSNSPPATCASSAAAAHPRCPTKPCATPAEETKPGDKLVLPLLDHQVQQVRDEDVKAILDSMSRRTKRRFMVVAEHAATAESAARAAVEKITRGEAPALMRGAQVLSLRVSRFRDMARDDAERRLAELRRAVRAAGGRAIGAVVFVEDMAWAATEIASGCCRYSAAVEQVVAEVRALACHDGDGVWVVGHGTYQSYMMCRAGRPSLEMLWELQTLAVPAGSLALSLSCVDEHSTMVVNHGSVSAKCDDRSRNGSSRVLSLLEAGSSGQLTAVSTFCGECSASKCEAVKPLPRSSIPHWLQHCREQELSHSKKWSLMLGGSPSHQTTLNLSTVSSPSSSVSSYENKHHHHHLHQPYQPRLLTNVHDARHQQTWNANSNAGHVHVIDDDDVVKLVTAIKVRSHGSSASNGLSAEEVRQCRSQFKELSAENLKALCSALEKEVPWQADVVPEIASTMLRCRSGMARRRRCDDDASSPRPASSRKKEDTWLLFLGDDAEGKARVAGALARLVFGSRTRFLSIGAAASSSPARSDSAEQGSKKRPRPSASCLNRLYEAVRDDPHRVIVVEDVDQADRGCQLGIREAIESGTVRSHGGDEAALGDAIVVLSCESFDARSRASSPPPPPPVSKKAKLESEEIEDDETTEAHHRKEAIAAAATSVSASSSFDLNMRVENDDVEDISFTDAGLLKALVDRAFFFRRLDETSH